MVTIMATTSWQGTRLGLIRVLRYEELGGLVHEEEGKDAAVVSLVMEWRRSKSGKGRRPGLTHSSSR